MLTKFKIIFICGVFISCKLKIYNNKIPLDIYYLRETSQVYAYIEDNKLSEAWDVLLDVERKYESMYVSGTRNDYLSLAFCEIKLGSRQRAIALCEKAIQSGADKNLIYKTFEDDSLILKEFNSLYDYNYEKFQASIDIELKDKINDLIQLDQKYRSLDKIDLSSGNVPSNKFKQLKLDSIIYLELIQIIKKKGWPSFRKIGNLDAGILLLHIPVQFRKHILKDLYCELLDANIPPGLYALVADRESYYNSGFQLYGTLTKFIPENSEVEYLDISGSLEEINKRRFLIGMESIVSEMNRKKFKLPFSINNN